MIRRVLLAGLWAAGLLLLEVTNAAAGPAFPGPITLEQPDGSSFEARLWGDEWLSGFETSDGFTIMQNGAGVWVYSTLDKEGSLTPSNQIVGKAPPQGLSPHLRPSSAQLPQAGAGSLPPVPQEAPPSAGVHPLLILVVDFTPSSSKGVSENEFRQHFFQGGGTYAPFSVRDYWNAVSYGIIDLEPAGESYGATDDGIVFVSLAYANPLCGGSIGNCHRTLTRDAILASDPQVNYASFDSNGDGYLKTDELHLEVVIRGNEGSFGGTSCGTPSTWAHRWSLGFSGVAAPQVDGIYVAHYRGAPTSGPYQGGYMQEGEWHEACPTHTPGHKATIGPAAHELGHDLGTGMPDLYDTDPFTGTNSWGIGSWGIQGYGSWLTTTAAGGHAGQVPAWPDAYSRWWFGFLTPSPVVGMSPGVGLPPIETALGTSRGVYLLPGGSYTHWSDCVGGTGEYWLAENRQQTGFDAGLPASGLLIWHIFEDIDNCDPNSDEGTSPPGNPRLVVLEQADGDFDLECYSPADCNEGDGGDPWPGSTSNQTFDGGSIPGSLTYAGSPSGVCITGIATQGSDVLADMNIVGCLFGTAALTRLERATGNLLTDGDYACPSGCFNAGSADLAERINISGTASPADVVEVDPDRPGSFRRSQGPGSRLAVGVISSAPGFTLGNLHGGAERARDERPLLALLGQVPTNASAENGPIQIGDLLVSAALPGHAMRCASPSACEGALIGKALQPLREGQGVILVLVMSH